MLGIGREFHERHLSAECLVNLKFKITKYLRAVNLLYRENKFIAIFDLLIEKKQQEPDI